MIEIVIFIATGLLAGMLGSVAGLGGGMVILPILEIAMGYDIPTAMGTSLFAIIFTSISSLQAHARFGHVDWKMGLYIGLSGIAGVVLGSWVFRVYLIDHVRVVVFFLGIWFWLLTARMAVQVYHMKKAVQKDVFDDAEPHYGKFPLITLGLITGIMAGILGVGGGAIMTSVMAALMGISPLTAVGTSFAAMLPLSLCGGLLKLAQGFVELKAGILLGIGTALGAQLGVFLLRFLSPITVKMLFVALFAILGGKYIFFG